MLATVLFTRIVNAPTPEGASEQAKRPWRDLLERHQAHVRKELELFKGREIEMNEDGLLATFDGPARAIRAACAISDFARRLGIKLRVGLHTGECDVMGDKVGGIAVEIGAQVAARASVGEVLVSHTVKDLVAGSGIRFQEKGIHTLNNIPEKWGLFAVERGACLK